MDAPAGQSLHLETRVPSRVRAGEPVPVTLVIRNAGPHATTLHLLGRSIAFDIVVTRGGRVAWRRLEGQAVPQILRVEQLEPGQGFTFNDRWLTRGRDGRALEPGVYEVHGELPTDAAPIRTPNVRVRIEP